MSAYSDTSFGNSKIVIVVGLSKKLKYVFICRYMSLYNIYNIIREGSREGAWVGMEEGKLEGRGLGTSDGAVEGDSKLCGSHCKDG